MTNINTPATNTWCPGCFNFHILAGVKKVLAEKIKTELIENDISCEIDVSDLRPGEKFYFWEMKGVPLRIEIGKREVGCNHQR